MEENANFDATAAPDKRPTQADDNDDTFSSVVPVDAIAARVDAGTADETNQTAISSRQPGDDAYSGDNNFESRRADGSDSMGDSIPQYNTSDASEAHGNAGSDAEAKAKPVPLFKPTDLPDLEEHTHDRYGDSDEDDNAQRAGNHDEFERASNASRDEFTTVYDLIDQLTESVNQAKSGFLSPGTVRLDRQQLLEQLDDLKTMLPVQLERASSLMREAERRLDNAQAEADSIVANAKSQQAQIIAEAQEQAQFLASQERVTDLARQKARKITDEAQANALKLTQGANTYCAQVMKTLSEQLTAYGRDVKNGIDVIDERQKAAAQQLAQVEGRQTGQTDGTSPSKKDKH